MQESKYSVHSSGIGDIGRMRAKQSVLQLPKYLWKSLCRRLHVMGCKAKIVDRRLQIFKQLRRTSLVYSGSFTFSKTIWKKNENVFILYSVMTTDDWLSDQMTIFLLFSDQNLPCGDHKNTAMWKNTFYKSLHAQLLFKHWMHANIQILSLF